VIDAQFIVDYLKKHPGYVKALYPKEDRAWVDEAQLLNPDDWEDVTDPEDAEPICWENWNVSWADGIRFLSEDGEIGFEET